MTGSTGVHRDLPRSAGVCRDGGGFGAENLASIGSFGAAYMTVIIVEPLADLAVLAAAKTLSRYATSPIFYNRLHHPAV